MSYSRLSIPVVAAFAALFFGLAGCGDDDDCCYVTEPAARLLIGPEGNRLHAYDIDSGASQIVVASHDDDAVRGRDINGVVCFAPDGSRRFIAGEDTGQPTRPPGWGVFQLHGSHIGDLAATQVGKLVPTYQASPDGYEPYSCAFLPDGRLLTADIGDQASGPGTGQLMLWFDPLGNHPTYCKLDVTVGTAGGIFVDDDNTIYLASARVAPGIYRYRGSLPTGPTAAQGCESTDSTGAPLTTRLNRDLWIPARGPLTTPGGIVKSAGGTFYVSSIVNGAILEYGADGTLLRTILRPGPGQQAPFETGTPFGLALDRDGTLYYADLGVVVSLPDVGPVDGRGSVRRIRFVGGEPQGPETINVGLDFPDGLAVLE